MNQDEEMIQRIDAAIKDYKRKRAIEDHYLEMRRREHPVLYAIASFVAFWTFWLTPESWIRVVRVRWIMFCNWRCRRRILKLLRKAGRKSLR